MAGWLYIWIILGFALVAAGLFFVLVGGMLIGHWADKKQTGARHGFLELPEELSSQTFDTDATKPEDPA